MIYDILTRDFLSLSEEEKNALLIYKTKLGTLINDLDNNPDYKSYYKYLLDVFKNPANAVVKITVYKAINLDSVEDFILSINKIKEIIDNALGKLVLPEDVTVYRAISSNEEIDGISKSNIISTSLSFGETLKFAQSGENIHLYKIDLHEGDRVMIIPYAILYDSKNNRLLLTSNQTQDEVILDKREYSFEEIGKDNISDGVVVISVNAINSKKNSK